MRSRVKLRWFKFGNKYLFQKSGIPIGGPVSGAVLEAVLSVDEDFFEKFGWRLFSSRLGLRGTRESYLTIARYVDDVFIATHWFCPCCVEGIVTRIYSKTVNFDPANDGLDVIAGFRVIKFLDLWCYASWQTTFFALSNKNDLFSFSGLVSLKSKNGFPIPQVTSPPSLNGLRAIFREG